MVQSVCWRQRVFTGPERATGPDNKAVDAGISRTGGSRRSPGLASVFDYSRFVLDALLLLMSLYSHVLL